MRLPCHCGQPQRERRVRHIVSHPVIIRALTCPPPTFKIKPLATSARDHGGGIALAAGSGLWSLT